MEPLATPERWFGPFDRAVFEAELAHCPANAYDWKTGQLMASIHSWLLRVDGKVILIDTCCGNGKNRPGWPGFHQLNYPYLERLHAAGVSPEDVDIVLCTHLHVDHVGWNTRQEGGRWVPTFPNARYLVARQELETMLARIARPETHPIERMTWNDSVLPIEEAGLLELTASSCVVLPGLRLEPAHGHTPGHVAIHLESRGERAVFSGDALHFPVQVPLWHWPAIVDKDPAQGIATRRELLENCAETGAWLLPAHFSAPHGVKISRRDDSFAIIC
ncbi:MBL fold metallo-hydrolase [Novosphingobium malaysiense]|uniref:MBL fold metallo-hydrolase n=1 Tax=Novosphingobium malaysiense TaxID=1348853 RepID=UPI0018CF9E84|nr:MBL fold metallo-hydrolase [Novosphingobium malaysiense]